jgi:putative ABC transport system permease protein
MPLTLVIAMRNLFQDRLRFIATIIGIVFSIVLVTVQMGLFLGFERMVTTMIDHAPADLWVVPLGTKCFEDPSLMDGSNRRKAMSVQGVADAVPMIIGFTQWDVPQGGVTPVIVIGSSGAGLRPWNVVQGNLADLAKPPAVAVDKTYFSRLGIDAIGEDTTIRERDARVSVVTDGIRSFTTTPYIFTTLDRAQAYIGTSTKKISYLLVHVSRGQDVDRIRTSLLAKLKNVEVLTPAQFSDRSRVFWLFGTGAGAALFAGALLGAIVGTIIVAQTLYSSTKDHLSEFVTLRAIGSSSLYIYKVIGTQAILSAVIGFFLAALIALGAVLATQETALPILMTTRMTLGLFLLTVLMCMVSAVAALLQVTRIEPASAFRQ